MRGHFIKFVIIIYHICTDLYNVSRFRCRLITKMRCQITIFAFMSGKYSKGLYQQIGVQNVQRMATLRKDAARQNLYHTSRIPDFHCNHGMVYIKCVS